MSRFDKDDEFTQVRLDLLQDDRKSLKRLAAKRRTDYGQVHAQAHRRCRECGLKIRGPGHVEGRDHANRKAKRQGKAA